MKARAAGDRLWPTASQPWVATENGAFPRLARRGPHYAATPWLNAVLPRRWSPPTRSSVIWTTPVSDRRSESPATANCAPASVDLDQQTLNLNALRAQRNGGQPFRH